MKGQHNWISANKLDEAMLFETLLARNKRRRINACILPYVPILHT